MHKSIRNTFRHIPKKGLLKNIAEKNKARPRSSSPLSPSYGSVKFDRYQSSRTAEFAHLQYYPEFKILNGSSAYIPLRDKTISAAKKCKNLWKEVLALVAGCAFGATLLASKKTNHSVNANEVEDYDSKSVQKIGDPFFNACRKGDLDLVKALVSEGRDINQRHKYGWSPLMVAAANNQASVVEYLLIQGADPDLQDQYSGAVKKTKGNFYFIELDAAETRRDHFPLLKDKEITCSGCTALHYAAALGSSNVVAALYKHGANTKIVNDDGLTAIELANGETVSAMNLLENELSTRRNNEVHQKRTLKDIIESKMVGQMVAKEQITKMIRRLETKWLNEKHPLVLLFVGGTGLGKTEMAKLVAKYLRGEEKDTFVVINLSEYQSKHEAAKFTGSPPGYVGYGAAEESPLIKTLTKNPNAVVLFDEADKAHPDVLATLLQLFDEGRLTSGCGKTVCCPEAVFILTANLGMREIKKFGKLLHNNSKEAETDRLDMHDLVREFSSRLLHGPVKDAFKRDELLGRINELAIFMPFTKEERTGIITKQLEKVKTIAAKRHGVALSWDAHVVDLLSRSINDKYGARNMRHEIDREIVSKLSMAQQNCLFHSGDFLHLQADRLIDDKESASYIALYKVSRTGSKENLSVRFAELSELYRVHKS